MMNAYSPTFSHNCSDCKFLAHYAGHDLFFCPQHGLGRPTVIARWGNDGPAYKSGLLGAEADFHLKVAKHLAVVNGFLKREGG